MMNRSKPTFTLEQYVMEQIDATKSIGKDTCTLFATDTNALEHIIENLGYCTYEIIFSGFYIVDLNKTTL